MEGMPDCYSAYVSLGPAGGPTFALFYKGGFDKLGFVNLFKINIKSQR